MGAKQKGPLWTVGLVVLILAGCHKEDQRNEPKRSQRLPPVPVHIQTVASKARVATEEVVGTVQSRLHAAIEAKVVGRVEKMLAVPGQMVKAGDLLAQLDAREIQARLDQAVALREQSRRDTERLRKLLAENAISRQEFETVESRDRVAAAAVTEAETMLGYTRILAPFDGVITRKLADVGDLATPGRPLLELDDPKSLRLEADMPEALISRIRLGTKLEVRVAAQDAPILAVVSEIAPVADPASRTFKVKLDLPADAGLRAGQFARVTVPVGESRAVRVPVAAVIDRGQMELVFVAANGLAQLRLVKTGKRVGDEVELVSGVDAGEQVIIEGATQLRDGQPLEVK